MSRKYRQRGYQDDERAPKAGGPSGPRERREGPRGRGLGAPTATVFRCGLCGRKQDGTEVAPTAECSGCGAPLHACKQCAHFDPSAPLECRRPIARRIADKAGRNECEHFESKRTQEFAGEPENAGDARAAFDDLFNL